VSQASEVGLKLVQGGYGGLRGWIEQVERMGELKRVSGASWDAEMGAITHMLTEHSHGTAPALLFDDIPGYPKGYRTLYGHFSSVKRGGADARPAAGARAQSGHRQAVLQPHPDDETYSAALCEGLGRSSRTCSKGDKIDILKFPVPRHHELDKARYIGTANCVITQDPDAGWFNLGCYRNQVYDGKTIGCQITEGKHGRIHRDKYFERGQSMKSWCWSARTRCCSCWRRARLPEGISELDFAGGLRGEPIEVIRGPYTGFPIPADAEIAIEAEAVPGHSREEGPFGEVDGLLLRRHGRAALSRHQDGPAPQRSDPDLRAAAQAGGRDGSAQGDRRRGADLALPRGVRHSRYLRRLEP
jgi:4-hydroxy-3-polyprenylbenzoate decarboxylase